MAADRVLLQIVTSDKSLATDLKIANIAGIHISTRVFTCDSVDLEPVITKTLTFIVEGSKDLDWGLVVAWLYDRFKKQQPDIASINGTDATNPEQILVIINNYVQVNQYTNNDDKKHE